MSTRIKNHSSRPSAHWDKLHTPSRTRCPFVLLAKKVKPPFIASLRLSMPGTPCTRTTSRSAFANAAGMICRNWLSRVRGQKLAEQSARTTKKRRGDSLDKFQQLACFETFSNVYESTPACSCKCSIHVKLLTSCFSSSLQALPP